MLAAGSEPPFPKDCQAVPCCAGFGFGGYNIPFINIAGWSRGEANQTKFIEQNTLV